MNFEGNLYMLLLYRDNLLYCIITLIKHFSLFHLEHIQNFVQPCLPKTNLLQGWGQRGECRYERAKEELFCFKGMGPEELKQKLEEETARIIYQAVPSTL